MKKLYLIRHAKSDWSNPSLDDYDRPLNKRGKKNAPKIGVYFNKRRIYPDLIISSPAYRARTTALKIAKKINYLELIEFNEHLYEASLKTILEIISFIEDENDDVFIIGHNPSLNMLAFYLVEFTKNIPTSGVLEIEFNCDSWREIKKSNAKLLSFEYPKKNYQKNQ